MCINFGIALIYVKLFLFEGMVYQQIIWIPMGSNCALLMEDFSLYCCEGILCLTLTNLNDMTIYTC